MEYRRDTHLLHLNVSSRRLPERLLDVVRRTLDRGLGFHAFNAIYSQLPPCRAADFPRILLEALSVHIELAGDVNAAIPASGPLIIVANHPFGLLDGVALDSLVMAVRPDVSAMAVQFFAAIPEFRARHIFVGRRGHQRRRADSVRGWRQAVMWLASGHALIMFPAAAVSHFQWRRGAVADGPWSSHIARVARRTGATILPAFVHGRVHWVSRLAGMMSPAVQDMLTIRELIRARDQTLRIGFGRPIQADELSVFASDDQATAFLRRETERIGGVSE